MNNPNFPASGFPAQPQTSPTSMLNNSTSMPQDGNIQQLGSMQSTFVNQFVNENQQTTPQQSSSGGSTSGPTWPASSPTWPASSPTMPANSPALPASDQAWPTNTVNVNPPMQTQLQNDVMPLQNDAMQVAPAQPALNTFTNTQPTSLPKLEDNDDFALPSLNNNPSTFQTEAPVEEMQSTPTPSFNDSSLVAENVNPPMALSQEPVEPLNNAPIDNMTTPLISNSLPDGGVYNPAPLATDSNQFQAPQSNFQPAPTVDAPPTTNSEPQGIGTHQITVNEDYADYYNRQQAALQMNAMNKQIEPMSIDFSRPATTLNVDQDFSDGGLPVTDNTGVSTGFLPAFDDTADDGLLPVVTGDDIDSDDISDPDDDSTNNAFVPYGFSNFDPNEDDAGTPIDSLSDFETKSLVDTAEKIDVDYFEQMPPIGSTQQNTSVFTQEPVMPNQPMASNSVPTLNYMNQNTQVVDQPSTLQPIGGQSFVPVNTTNDQMLTPTQATPSVEPVVGELSPAARLNQLLEAEEAAEKVVMQKQDQMLDKAPETQQSRQSKVNVFKQLDPDASFDSDLKSQMSVKKPSSKYFLIFSVVIIISIIGFLLVLLGLMLL